MKTSDAGIKLIQRFEGLVLKPYQDTAGVWTVGYGHTRSARSLAEVELELTQEQATHLLRWDLRVAEGSVKDLVTAPITQHQFDALVSFTFNLGYGNLARSDLLRRLNRGDYTGASDQFLRWTKAGGRELLGLIRRREAERAMFRGQLSAT